MQEGEGEGVREWGETEGKRAKSGSCFKNVVLDTMES